nr:hypothetical protein [Tanacetum cinerariifolium]
MEFLSTCSINYALTVSPIIYASYIEQFWNTAISKTINSVKQIHAIVDGKAVVISESSVRSDLLFNDEDGVDVRHGGSATTVSSLDARQGNGNIDKTQFMPHDSPLQRVNTLGSDEGSMTLNELMVLYTKLSQKVESLEADLKQTKKVYGATYTKLIIKVKKLEKTIKLSQIRRRENIVVSDDEELEDPSKQGRSMIEEIDQDTEVHLVTPTQVNTQEESRKSTWRSVRIFSADKVLAEVAKVHTCTRRRSTISTASGETSTAEESVSTAGASMSVSTAGMVDTGKAIMQESEPELITTKLKQRQERAGYEAAIRLQEQLDEEERHRIARMHEEATSFNAPRNHIGGADAQTRFETTPKRSSDPPLSTGHTVGSGEDMMEQETDLTDFVPPTPHDSPLSGGHTPGSDEVKRLEKKQRERNPEMKLFKIGNSKKKTLDKENDVNAAERVSTAGDAVNAASVDPDVIVVGPSTSVVGPSTSTGENIFKDEITTMADTLMAIRRTRPRTASVVIHDVEEESRRATPPLIVQSQDKEQRFAREKAAEQETKDVALIEKMKDVQARIDADTLLAERLQQEEREQFTVDEQARMLVDLIAKRKRFFAIQRVKQMKNKPPTKPQLRNKMVTYLKYMEVNASKQQAEGSKKRSRVDHDKESVKTQKLEEDDAEKEKLRACLDIVLVDDIAIDVESLATKYLIVDRKIHTLTEHMIYYQIIKANGSSKNYKILTKMCDDFDRQDIMDLYRLVKERYATTSPEGYDLLIWGNLITLFEPSKEDVIWKAQQDYNLISWRLFDSCGVHVLLMDTGIAIDVLVERKYPLIQEMLSRMLNRRL